MYWLRASPMRRSRFSSLIASARTRGARSPNSVAATSRRRASSLPSVCQPFDELSDAAEAAASGELTRAAHLYRNGWRTFYAAIATGAWLAGAWMMLLTTIIIVGIDIAAKIE